ncbi:MAG TPA: DUF378 domain-containing protein [Gammaproteobacteria bacterium]|nr:DUF378 domain-containing protein [Gammaproteobacteria bacterium]
MADITAYRFIALILLVIGGLNWGLVGLFNFNLVTTILGNVLGRIVFVLVGIAAAYMCYMIYLDKFGVSA